MVKIICLFECVVNEFYIDLILEALNEVPFQNEFDKRIVENLFVNLSKKTLWILKINDIFEDNSKGSRFKFAQENCEDDEDDSKFDVEPRPETDIEFNVIYKSIQDYVDLSTNPATSHKDNSSSNPSKKTGSFSIGNHNWFYFRSRWNKTWFKLD